MAGESELYPQEALADAERRYLRRQKPLEVRRRRFGLRGWPLVRRWIFATLGAAFSLLACYQIAHFFLFSPYLQLASSNQIQVTGNHYVSAAAVAERFSSDLGHGILSVPLEKRRAALEEIPWVAQARIQRALPNRLRVELIERSPVAFLRTTAGLALLDADGVVLERPQEGAFHFPVVTGISQAMAPADRQKRMRLFLDFLRDAELARPGASEAVSEVDLADAADVRATLTGLPQLASEETLFVRFGDQDFVNKYRLLVENLDQWLARSGHIESVDLRFARQVVVNPERESAATRP